MSSFKFKLCHVVAHTVEVIVLINMMMSSGEFFSSLKQRNPSGLPERPSECKCLDKLRAPSSGDLKSTSTVYVKNDFIQHSIQ